MTKDQLRRFRRRLLLNQTELAHLAGTCQEYVSQIERGARHSEPLMRRLEHALQTERIRQGLPDSIAA